MLVHLANITCTLCTFDTVHVHVVHLTHHTNKPIPYFLLYSTIALNCEQCTYCAVHKHTIDITQSTSHNQHPPTHTERPHHRVVPPTLPTGTYQRRVALVHFLAHLYNYGVVDSRAVFDTLYLFTSAGHDDEQTIQRMDAPSDCFRIRCVLVGGCGWAGVGGWNGVWCMFMYTSCTYMYTHRHSHTQT